MGKNNKKNRNQNQNQNQNRVEIDDDLNNINPSNVSELSDGLDGFEEVTHKKSNRNIFAQLDSDENIDDIKNTANTENNEEYCNYCKYIRCVCAHGSSKPIINENIHLKSDKQSEDYYFAKGYHADDYEHDYNEAIKHYKDSLIHDSEHYKSIASYNMALIYEEKLNDIENAEKYYKISCEKNYKDAFVNLALLYFNQEKYVDAEKYFKKAVEFGYCKIYYEYAKTLEKLDKKEEAFKYLQYHLMLKNANTTERNMWRRLIKK
jgi:tetratricopeptide (TPR) repeat protein